MGNVAGQAMMEYLIIAALIAAASIGIYSAYGQTIRHQTAGLAQEAAGKAAKTSNAENSANASAGRANDPNKKGMGHYNYANDQN